MPLKKFKKLFPLFSSSRCFFLFTPAEQSAFGCENSLQVMIYGLELIHSGIKEVVSGASPPPLTWLSLLFSTPAPLHLSVGKGVSNSAAPHGIMGL